MSGYNEREALRLFAGPRRVAFLQEPLDIPELLKKVREVLFGRG